MPLVFSTGKLCWEFAINQKGSTGLTVVKLLWLHRRHVGCGARKCNSGATGEPFHTPGFDSLEKIL